MTDWDVSRHPKWGQMYAAGVTVSEIADWCHVNLATVHLHLRVVAASCRLAGACFLALLNTEASRDDRGMPQRE